MSSSYPCTRPLRGIWSAWLAPLALATLALFVYTLHLDRPAHFDELYHVLAARAWLTEGEFLIAEGTYNRAPLFTLLVAWCFSLFGESLEVARAPSITAAVLLVVAVFLWTRAVAGDLAAWVSALLLCLWPDGITVAQFARFYALQGLFFWLGAIGVYVLFTRRYARGPTFALAVGSALCFALALHLQKTTLIGLVGVFLWIVLAVGLPWLRAPSTRPGLRWGMVGGTAALLVAAAAVLLFTGLGAVLLAEYRWAPLWNSANRNAFWFYHQDLSLHYPALWPFLPFIALVGLAFRPRPTLFCLCVFTTAFLLLSFAGMKHERYIHFVVPFLFVMFGIALARIGPYLWRFAVETAEGALDQLGFGRRAHRAARRGLIGTALLFLVAANAAFVKTGAHLLDVTVPPMQRPPDWAAAKPILGPWLRDAAIVLTTSEIPTLYYLGRYDMVVSKSRLGELGVAGEEFARDPRTGRPVISTPESLTLIMACYPDGLLITSDERWRNPAQLSDDVADLVRARTTEIDLPGARRVHAYYWQQPADAEAPAACSALPELPNAAVTALAAGRPHAE